MRWKMLDRIYSMEAGRRAKGVKAVTQTEDYFEHHMPYYPIVPGAMLVEIMAQLGGRLAMYSAEKQNGTPSWAAVSYVEEAKFFSFVFPGYMMTVEAELVELDAKSAVAECQILVAEHVFATARVGFFLTAFDLSIPEARQGLDYVRRDMRQLWQGYDLEYVPS